MTVIVPGTHVTIAVVLEEKSRHHNTRQHEHKHQQIPEDKKKLENPTK